MRKRVRATKASNAGRRPYKKARTLTMPRPRYRALANPMSAKVMQELRCEVTYCEYGVSLDAGIGTAASYVFAANGLYDPNITGVGHQPMGFDQLMGLYNQYIVIGGIITVRFSNWDGQYTQLIGITMKDSAAVSSDPRQYIEWGNTTWDQIGVLSGNDTKTLKHKFDIAKFANQDIFNESDYSGSSSFNPTKTLHLVVWAAPGDAIANPNPVYATVEITYDVVFRNPGATALS